MKEMEGVLKHLNELLEEDRSSLIQMKNLLIEDDSVFVIQGRIQTLEYVIKKIEETLEQSLIETVSDMTNFLKGEHENI